MNNTSKELWKDVIYPGVRENMYEVSNKGRIRNKNTKRILPGYKHRSGYIYINLMKPGKGSYVFRYHRIVATAWVSGHTEERDVVNHIDGNKQNNDPSNLEWVTFEENVQHAFRNHLFKPRIGENNANCKIQELYVHRICELLLTCKGHVAKVQYILMEKYQADIPYSTIYGIKIKKTWTNISDQYFTDTTDFEKHRELTKDEVVLICETLLENDMNTLTTFNQLRDKIPVLSRNRVYRIKFKMAYTYISDDYF